MKYLPATIGMLAAGAAGALLAPAVLPVHAQETGARVLAQRAQSEVIQKELEVMTRGGTDTRELQLSGLGALAGAVSIPTRYVHQVVETLHPDDLDASVRLVAAFCETAHTLVEGESGPPPPPDDDPPPDIGTREPVPD